mgnify:FL=1|tara:strand:- start:199 stop:780 length:582 start_codon:yes stop_codon:yes gene_type:complete
MDDILNLSRYGDFPIRGGNIPPLIMDEITEWVNESKKIKSSPLAELKAHENVGYRGEEKHNSYQCSISPYLIEKSFWLSWVLRLVAKYSENKNNRGYKLRKWDGHFDGYDIWTNFSYKGDDNPSHNHAGYISGVIYYKNHNHPTIFDDYGFSYPGFDGTMILFPSDTLHHVESQTEDKERITLAFNIIQNDSF